LKVTIKEHFQKWTADYIKNRSGLLKNLLNTSEFQGFLSKNSDVIVNNRELRNNLLKNISKNTELASDFVQQVEFWSCIDSVTDEPNFSALLLKDQQRLKRILSIILDNEDAINFISREPSLQSEVIKLSSTRKKIAEKLSQGAIWDPLYADHLNRIVQN